MKTWVKFFLAYLGSVALSLGIAWYYSDGSLPLVALNCVVAGFSVNGALTTFLRRNEFCDHDLRVRIRFL